MRGRLRQRLGRYSKKTWIFIVLGVVVIGLLGGGAYAAFGGVAHSQDSSDIELQRGLVGWWKMNGNAKDATPYGDDGTVSGAVLAADREGATNNAYSFATNTDNIAIPSNSALNSAVFTYSAWIKPTSLASNGTIIGTASNGGPQFRINSSTGALVLNSENVVAIGQTTTGVSTNVWSHVAVSYDASGNYAFYINGVKQPTSGTPPNLKSLTFSSYTFGKKGSSTTESFVGSMSDVRMYNRVLSANEMKALASVYNSQTNLNNGENGLVGWWKLDGNAKDSTPFGNNGTVNGATLTTDRKGAVNSAYAFNGSTQQISVPSFNLTSAITVCAWADPAVSQSTKIVGKHSGTTDAQGTLGVSSGNAQFEITTNAVYHSVVAASSLALNQWSLVCGTYDGSTVTLYVNGASAATTAATGAIATNSFNWSIGSLHGGLNSGNFNGSIDDVRIYSRALSLSDVTNLYKSYNSQISLNSNPSTSGTTNNINVGMVGYWPFSGNAKDATPYSNDSTSNTGVLAPDRYGRTNNAYSFNGTGQRILLPSAELPTSTITVSAWVEQTAWSSFYDLVWHEYTTMATYGTDIFSDSSGTVSFGVGNSVPNRYVAVCASGGLTKNVWHMVTGTYDGTTVKAYLDGQLCATTATVSGATLSNTGTFKIGETGTGTTHYIDEVRVYNRALSATEVQALYASRN